MQLKIEDRVYELKEIQYRGFVWKGKEHPFEGWEGAYRKESEDWVFSSLVFNGKFYGPIHKL